MKNRPSVSPQKALVSEKEKEKENYWEVISPSFPLSCLQCKSFHCIYLQPCQYNHTARPDSGAAEGRRGYPHGSHRAERPCGSAGVPDPPQPYMLPPPLCRGGKEGCARRRDRCRVTPEVTSIRERSLPAPLPASVANPMGKVS